MNRLLFAPLVLVLALALALAPAVTVAAAHAAGEKPTLSQPQVDCSSR